MVQIYKCPIMFAYEWSSISAVFGWKFTWQNNSLLLKMAIYAGFIHWNDGFPSWIVSLPEGKCAKKRFPCPAADRPATSLPRWPVPSAADPTGPVIQLRIADFLMSRMVHEFIHLIHLCVSCLLTPQVLGKMKVFVEIVLERLHTCFFFTLHEVCGQSWRPENGAQMCGTGRILSMAIETRPQIIDAYVPSYQSNCCWSVACQQTHWTNSGLEAVQNLFKIYALTFQLLAETPQVGQFTWE